VLGKGNTSCLRLTTSSALSQVTDKLDEAGTAAQTAETETDEALEQAVGPGANAAIEGLSAVKDHIEKLTGLLASAGEGADEALTTARSVADST
jgi:hypothetical protein